MDQHLLTMKAEQIILIRHAHTEANDDRSIYTRTPQHKVPLSAAGDAQARITGSVLREKLGGRSTLFYVSPTLRCLQTLEGIIAETHLSHYAVEQEPRLRAQSWGPLDFPDAKRAVARKTYPEGVFFTSFPGGESGAEVYDRVSSFADYLRSGWSPQHPWANVVIVSHGLVIRLFLMAWFRWTVDMLESSQNLRPGEMMTLLLDQDGEFISPNEL